MDKLITIKLVLAIICISLTFVAFANKTRTASWQNISVKFAKIYASQTPHHMVPVMPPPKIIQEYYEQSNNEGF
ncbi:hypothetical protein [Legionella hackeliae]|uniref:Uncharacterized protein n=1 Tax=Legionella hackeliae TaxID=449 RepID=A0A0A8UW48_LEGHA|nr:hypothetical protein [Legionella hackeliae]KTD09948.1 hypothetical protein Lhac_2316 [Legionella hackeliae]CEK11751.1 exported protein of unknown function [Legionella hackeliae]STX48521.1 Uncharacterised protein [Legionella hackeliae]